MQVDFRQPFKNLWLRFTDNIDPPLFALAFALLLLGMITLSSAAHETPARVTGQAKLSRRPGCCGKRPSTSAITLRVTASGLKAQIIFASSARARLCTEARMRRES